MAIRKKTKVTRRAPRRAAKPVKKTAPTAAAQKTARKKQDTAPQPEQSQTQYAHHARAPDYSQLFAQMGAPFIAMLHTAASTQNTDSNHMMHNWIGSQRQQWQHLLDSLQQPKVMHDAWQTFGQSPFMHMPYGRTGFSGSTTTGSGSAFADLLRGGQAFNPFDQLASLPGLGYLRERHEEFARLYKAWQAHEAAQQKYNAEMAHIMLEALTRFESSLALPSADQKPFASLKDIYAHWVNTCEDVYARFAGSPTHTALYGDVVNTLSAVKREMAVAIDHWAAQMNLPTRSEVDSLHQRMHEMKREMREMKRTHKETPSSKRRRK